MCNQGETVPPTSVTRELKSRRSKRRRRAHLNVSTIACAVLAGSFQTSMAKCISLQGSTACPAFNASSISNDDANVGLFPFLADVTDLNSFDNGIRSYISNGYAQIKYVSKPQIFLSSTDGVVDTSSFWAALISPPIIPPTSTPDTPPPSYATTLYRIRSKLADSQATLRAHCVRTTAQLTLRVSKKSRQATYAATLVPTRRLRFAQISPSALFQLIPSAAIASLLLQINQIIVDSTLTLAPYVHTVLRARRTPRIHAASSRKQKTVAKASSSLWLQRQHSSR